MKQKTALQQAIDDVINLPCQITPERAILNTIKVLRSLLPKEREHIENAYDQHRCCGNFENGNDYYEKTFKQ